MVFGIATTTGIIAYSSSNAALTGVSVFAVLFYQVLLLFATNEEGARDKIRVDAGRLERDNFLGLKWALAANSLNLLLAVIIIPLYFFQPATEALFTAFGLIARLIQSPYLGLAALYCPYNPILYLLMPLPSLIVCWFGYYIGLRGVLILPEKKKRT